MHVVIQMRAVCPVPACGGSGPGSGLGPNPVPAAAPAFNPVERLAR
jgi:hypothetical protein